MMEDAQILSRDEMDYAWMEDLVDVMINHEIFIHNDKIGV